MRETTVTGLECVHCGAEYPAEPRFEGCRECRTDNRNSNLAPVYDYKSISLTRSDFENRGGGVWAIPELLPVRESVSVSIGEGDTPLVSAGGISDRWGSFDVYLKDESQNPTWSYKDRLSSVALTKAVDIGADAVTIASTGNHGASTAAYAARAGLESVIFTIPSVPDTMKTLMQVYGARVVATPTHKDRWTIMQKCIEEFEWYPTGNYVFPPVGSNFYGIEGYKSIAYEIATELNWEVPDWIIQPTAYADGLSGIWRGFVDLHELGLIDELPTMVAVEPFGPLKNALGNNLDHVEAVDSGETVSFSIGAGISTQQGLVTLQESEGEAVIADDTLVRDLQIELGKATGMYSEASAVAGLAGVETLYEQGRIGASDSVVVINTSTGLKDTEMTAESLADVPLIEPNIQELRTVLSDVYGISI